MSFLKKIDLLHEEYRRFYSIDASNKSFSSFIHIEPLDIELSQRFVIKKQKNSQLLIISGKQRVYLSDFSIISTILQMEHSYAEWFLNEFINAYNNSYKSFKFKIADEIFESVGISYYPKKKSIYLFSDTEIDINDLIFVINFIFSKDYQWEIDKTLLDFRKNTIVKFITLIDYYANKCDRSRKFLASIGYPIDQDNYIDNITIKSFFSDVNSFDISLYM